MRIALTSLDLAATERLLIEHALAEAGSPADAAPLLGITPDAMKRRITKHRIEWPRASTTPAVGGPAQPVLLILDSPQLVTAERRLIERALSQTGQICEAAKLLGVTRHAVKRRIVKHGIKFRSVHPAHAGQS